MHAAWKSLRAAAALALVALVCSSCLLIFPLPETSEGAAGAGGAPSTCNTDSDCDDSEACTVDTCGADKVCVHSALDDGPAPLDQQKAGDCRTIVCEGGASKSKPDDGDILDDGKDCTIDSCKEGVPVHVPKPNGTQCDAMGNGGRCDPLGECMIICTKAADCIPNAPCVTVECDTTQGICIFLPLSDGTPTPGAAQPAGDCHIHICIGGQDVNAVDDSDVPVTSNDCDLEVCTDGVPSNPPKTGNPPCSTYNGSDPGHCSNVGVCSQCASDDECTGPIDDCRRPACVNFACTEAYTAANTTTTGNPPQVAGDCQRIVCDGNGGTTLVYDTADPENDNNACKSDVCTAQTVTQHNDVADGAKCGVNDTLACVGGQCAGCTVNTQCTAASCSNNTITFAQTCNGSGVCVNPTPSTQGCAPYLCDAANNGCTTSCNDDAGCSQAGAGSYCSNNQCIAKLPIGSVCTAGSQCQGGNCVDGYCCNNACGGSCQACSAAKKGGGANGQCAAIANGTDPDNECPDDGVLSCDRDGFCDGAGACRLYAAGTVCTASSCGGTTLTKQKACNGSGTCVTPTPATQDCAPFLCTGGACTTTCTNDAQCAQSGNGNWCNNGTCTAKLAQGSGCTGNNQCQTPGQCVDGYCCNSACNTACNACSAALKATGAGNGTCGAAKVNMADPRSLCGMSPPCGNTGLCASGGVCQKTASGTSCVAQSCVGATLTAAKTCDGSGACSVGGGTSTCAGSLVCNTGAMACYASCLNGGTPDDSRCISGDYCDAVGVCHPKIPNGGSGCTADNACQNGHCGLTNGVCCSATCTDQGAGTCGTSGSCATGTGACLMYGNTTSCSASSCSGSTLTTATLCNGTGTCNGGTSNSPCPNGFACQNGTTCRTTCSNAGHCQSGYTCNGNTCQMLLMAGDACTSNAQCASGACGTIGTGFCCGTACNVSDATCKATACASGTGACQYPGVATSCGTPVCNTTTDQIQLPACNSAGACTPGAFQACPSNLQCEDSDNCWNACGTNDAAGDAKCVDTHYCNGTNCMPRKTLGAVCTRNTECTLLCVGGFCT